MRAQTTVFYDVDTQRDFLLSSGALSVPDGARILPALRDLTQFARKHRIRIVAQVDRHYPDDPELMRSGGPYPDHCMNRTEGQLKVDETAPSNPMFIGSELVGEEERIAALEWRGEVVLEKRRLDVLDGNANARQFLAALVGRYRDFVVYGVCTDICVDMTVQRLLALGANVTVVHDAIAELNAEQAQAAIEKWKAAGVNLLSSSEIKSRLS